MLYKLENRRYIGCKTKLLDWIFQLIDTETTDIHTFCDMFAGTGTVSKRALEKYEHVIINDFLYSNNLIYKAFFGYGEWSQQKVDEIITSFNNTNTVALSENYFSKNYGGKYFDSLSARKIGWIRDEIERIKCQLNWKEYCILMASLIYSMDRVANTLGHYESYRKIQLNPHEFIMHQIEPCMYAGAEMFREDANILARTIHADLVYIDPPYNSRQYSRFYHVYEVLTKWDKPNLLYDAAKPRFTENNSAYCRTEALNVFTDLVAHLDTRYLAVSYNNTYHSKSSSSENKIKLEELQNTLEKCGSTKVFTHAFNPFNAGKTEFDDHREYLFITKVDNEKRNSSFATLLCR